jgi:3-methylcrotonyl-CoA carboxylase alpha subunit
MQCRDGSVLFDTDGLRLKAEIVSGAGWISVFHDGLRYDFNRIDDLALAEAEHTSGDSVISPMPGLVSAVRTATRAAVRKGDALVVLEAMKMEHVLTAPRDGVVAEMLVTEGDQVTDGQLLLRLEAQDG